MSNNFFATYTSGGGEGSDGTVTSITAGTGLTGGTITTSGTIALAIPVTVPDGGTGDTSLTLNGVLYGNGTAAVGAVAAGTTGQVLTANTGSAPTWSSTAVPTGNLTDAGTDGITITGGTGAVVGSGTSVAQHVSDASHNGYLSASDWTTFNNKAPSFEVANLSDSGTDGITVTNGTGAVIGTGTSLSQHVADTSHNGYLSAADWNTFNGKQAALTIGNLTDAGTDGITVTGGTGSVIGSGTSIAQAAATASQNGYLTSTDWSTFNGKGSGTVTAVSVASANGFTGSSSGGATPALTLTTSINSPVLAGNGTAIAGATTTGSGSTVVLATGPTLSAPVLGTPASGNLSNCSGYPSATASAAGTITSFVPVIASAVKTVSSAAYAILDNDGFDVFLVTTGASNRAITLPAPANNTGRTLKIKKVDSGVGAAVVTQHASETIDGLTTLPLAFQYQEVQLACDGTNWFIIAHPTPFYYETNDDDGASDGAQTEASFFNTTVPYAAIYRISCNFVVFSGTTVGNVGNATISIKTGSATYSSATYRVTGSSAQVSTAVTNDRGQGFLVAEWTGSLSAGDTVHMGVGATSVVGGVLHNQHFMMINEIRRN